MYLTSLLYDGIFMRKFYLFLLRPSAHAAVALPFADCGKRKQKHAFFRMMLVSSAEGLIKLFIAQL